MSLLQVIEPVAQDHGLEVVDALAKQGPGRAHVRVVVDTPEGDGRVSVSECAAVSREIGHGLEAADFLSGSPYVLEVTSPGVDRTLGREKDFARAVGCRVALETREPLAGGRRRFRGTLLSFDGQAASVQTEDGAYSIPFDSITRARAFYPFEAQGAKR